MDRELKQSYDRVFNEDGTVKLCGREACKDLIIAMQSKFPGINFGNPVHGIMNITNIQTYYKE